MSDRIGVFNRGRLEQVGTPQQIYNAPSTRFVAQFVGAANVLEGPAARELLGVDCAMLRPEQIGLVAAEQGQVQGQVQGWVDEVQYFGSFTRVRVKLRTPADVNNGGATLLQVDLPAGTGTAVPLQGERVGLRWTPAAVHTLS